MAKVAKKKTSQDAGKERKKLLRAMTETIAKGGDELGNDIIEMRELGEIDPVVLGIAVVGLAKAWAMVRDVARRTGVNVDKLYKGQLAHYRRVFERIEHKDEMQD